jgi:hypothetical protein
MAARHRRDFWIHNEQQPYRDRIRRREIAGSIDTQQRPGAAPTTTPAYA